MDEVVKEAVCKGDDEKLNEMERGCGIGGPWEGYVTGLMTCLTTAIPDDARLLAAICLKHCVVRRWRPVVGKHAKGAISEGEKKKVRDFLMASQGDGRIRAQLLEALRKCVRADWPRSMSIEKIRNPEALAMIFKELQTKRLPADRKAFKQLADDLLPDVTRRFVTTMDPYLAVAIRCLLRRTLNVDALDAFFTAAMPTDDPKITNVVWAIAKDFADDPTFRIRYSPALVRAPTTRVIRDRLVFLTKSADLVDTLDDVLGFAAPALPVTAPEMRLWTDPDTWADDDDDDDDDEQDLDDDLDDVEDDDDDDVMDDPFLAEQARCLRKAAVDVVDALARQRPSAFLTLGLQRCDAAVRRDSSTSWDLVRDADGVMLMASCGPHLVEVGVIADADLDTWLSTILAPALRKWRHDRTNVLRRRGYLLATTWGRRNDAIRKEAQIDIGATGDDLATRSAALRYLRHGCACALAVDAATVDPKLAARALLASVESPHIMDAVAAVGGTWFSTTIPQHPGALTALAEAATAGLQRQRVRHDIAREIVGVLTDVQRDPELSSGDAACTLWLTGLTTGIFPVFDDTLTPRLPLLVSPPRDLALAGIAAKLCAATIVLAAADGRVLPFVKATLREIVGQGKDDIIVEGAVELILVILKEPVDDVALALAQRCTRRDDNRGNHHLTILARLALLDPQTFLHGHPEVLHDVVDAWLRSRHLSTENTSYRATLGAGAALLFLDCSRMDDALGLVADALRRKQPATPSHLTELLPNLDITTHLQNDMTIDLNAALRTALDRTARVAGLTAVLDALNNVEPTTLQQLNLLDVVQASAPVASGLFLDDGLTTSSCPPLHQAW